MHEGTVDQTTQPAQAQAVVADSRSFLPADRLTAGFLAVSVLLLMVVTTLILIAYQNGR